jgi:hypothetical protein
MQNIKTEFEAAKALLLEHGVQFTLPGRSIFGKAKERSFLVKQSYLGTLYHLSKLYLQLEINENTFSDENWMTEAKKLYKHAPIMSRVVATAYLNSKWKIRLFARPLSTYFLWHITPSKMVDICKMIIVDLNNMQDFMITIKLLSVSPMTTPKNRDLSPLDNGG